MQAQLLPFCRQGKWLANMDVWEHIQCLVFFLQIGSDLRVQTTIGRFVFEPITPYPAIVIMLLYCGRYKRKIKNCHSTGTLVAPVSLAVLVFAVIIADTIF